MSVKGKVICFCDISWQEPIPNSPECEKDVYQLAKKLIRLGLLDLE